MLSAPYEVEAKTNDDGEWWVYFDFFPARPGAHATVIIDKKGKVVRAAPGK
jgi:hypothetical protein